MSNWTDDTTNEGATTSGTGPVVSTTSDANAGTVTVIGKVKDGKLVKSWNGRTTVLSDRTLNALEKIGVTIVDDPNQYLF